MQLWKQRMMQPVDEGGREGRRAGRQRQREAGKAAPCPLLSEKTCRHCSLFWVWFSVLSATFLVQHSMSIGVLQCNSHFFVKNTWNIRYSLTNINLLYLKIYKRHNLPLQKEKNAYLYFFEYFYFPFWKQRLCHLYILGKVDLYF